MSVDIRQALQRLQGFESINDESLETIAKMTKVRSIKTGETIFCQGEPSPFFFGILSGEVTIQRVSSDSRFPKKILGIVGPGGLFGESSIFEDSPRMALASASKDGELLVIRGVDFRNWMRNNPAASQPMVLSLLQTALGRLHLTSQELSVVYGIGRLLGSNKPFVEQLSSAMDFMKSSLKGLDDIVFYARNPYWDEFAPLQSLPQLQDIPPIPLNNDLIQKVCDTGSLWMFEPKSHPMALQAFQLGWENRAAVALIPLFHWEKTETPLQGLLLLASTKDTNVFSAEKLLLLTSLAQPLAEALSRHKRIQDAQAQSRLEHSRQTYKQ